MKQNEPALTEEEAAKLAADFRDALMNEHESRVKAQEHREERSREKHKARVREQEILAEEQIKEHVRAEFYKEQGYKLYTDSAGRQHWLTRSEYDWRIQARARRDKNHRSFDFGAHTRQRRLTMYAGSIILAIAMGLWLLR
jgi:predicted Zn-dependent protease